MNKNYWLWACFFLSSFIGSLHGQAALENAADSITFSVDMDDVLVTAQYKPTHFKSVLHKVDVIKEEAIINRGITQLDQALLISPLIRIDQDPQLGAKIRLRGISSRNVAILIDGVPMIGRLDGSLDLSQISMQNVQRIEIVEGPLSNIYGNNAAGGVINIITKKSQVKQLSLSSENNMESIGVLNNQLSLGWQNDKLRVGTYGRSYVYDQYAVDSLRIVDKVTYADGSIVTESRYPWNPKKQQSYGGNVLYRINEDNSINFKTDINHEVVKDYGSIKRPTFKPYANDANFRTDRQDFTLIYDGLINKNYHIDAVLAKNQFQRVSRDQRYYLETMEFDSLLYTVDSTRFNAWFSRFNVARAVGDKYEVIAGVTYNNEVGKGDKILDKTRVDTTTAAYHETAVYSELRYKPIPSTQLSVSGRMSFHSAFKNQFTPAFQAKTEINKFWTLRAGIAQGYRSPDLKEMHIEFIDINHYVIGNPLLKPEISTDIQATLSYHPNNKIEVSVNGYNTAIENRISLIEYETQKYKYDNVDTYKVRGMQTSFNIDYGIISWASSLSLGFWSTNIADSSTPAFGQVFDMNHSLNLKWKNTGLTTNFRHVGKQPLYIQKENGVEINSFSAVDFIDISANQSFLKGKIVLIGGAKNLLDIKKSNVLSSNAGPNHTEAIATRQISQGVSFFAGLRIRL